MNALARPAVLASLPIATALLLHPGLGLRAWLPAHALLLTALLTLCAAALVARAWGRRELAAALVAAGASFLLVGLALDGVRGTQGTLSLALGRASNNFEERAPSGRPLGLRPLGFSIGFARVTAAGAVALVVPGQSVPVELPTDDAIAIGGYRLSQPRLRLTGGVARVRVAMSDGTRTEVVELVPGQPARASGLQLQLSEYFPDFALDERQQPFSRTLEPRNPAALIDIEKDGARHRAFVLRSMPGVHRVEPLGLAFSMLDVEPEQSVEVAVHREPFAWLVLGGGLLVVVGLLTRALRESPRAVSDRTIDSVTLAGGLLVMALLLASRGQVLGWQFAVGSGNERVLLSGVGVLLGLALLTGLAGTLLRAAASIAGASPPALSRIVLGFAAACTGAGALLAFARVAALPRPTASAAVGVCGVAASALLLALVLFRTRAGRADEDALAPLLPSLVLAAVLAAVGLGWLGLERQGTYASGLATAALACALLGFASLEPTVLSLPRRLLFLGTTLALLLGAG